MESNKTESEIVKDALANKAGEHTTVTILTGSAPAQLKEYNPKAIEISGTIDAPSRFAEVREFDQKKSHALVSVSRGEIVMVVNEQNTDDTHTIKGRVIISREFAGLGINQGKEYSPEKLAQYLKLKRSIFESRAAHGSFIASLRKIKATVKINIEKAKDDKANVTDVFTQTVETEMPESFILNVPLIEGGEPVRIEVFAILEADGNDIICTLESADAAEGIDEYRSKIVFEEVEKLKEKTTIIFTD